MKSMNEIICLNTNIRKKYPVGTSLKELIKDQNIKLAYPILGARVNNEIEELNYEIFKPKQVEFIDITDKDGLRMYVRSLTFILISAAKKIFPNSLLKLEHSISKGLFCDFTDLPEKLTDEKVTEIKRLMKEIIAKDIPFVKNIIKVPKAIKIFKENNFEEKARLFTTCPELYTTIYYLENQVDYFYGYLVPSTGYLKVFDLIKYEDGMLLQLPSCNSPEKVRQFIRQPKLYDILREHKKWVNILDVETIGRLNEVILDERDSELIKIGEALHEKKVAWIADKIVGQAEKVRIVLVSGPSSAGKTTFSKRLAIQLKVEGLKPVLISLDNYFVNRKDTPKDENGDYDFEALEALDVKLFNRDYAELMRGKEVDLPKFSFEKGERYYSGDKLRLTDENILIVEGIHALNPKLTPTIPDSEKFKVYVSALTQLGIDNHNRIPTTDNRLIRRIIRDFKYRGYNAIETLNRWESVRRGEERNIFPYQENADVMFNSALIFELAVLKTYVEPLLKEVPQSEREYSEAQRLLKFLSYIKTIETNEIPPTSILREFLQGSTFHY
ncbi:MAG: AAA family ATPase [Bacteroidia bacterium]|nr:MAG: AAA family ATPase [Bacteroidia bacterium]